MIQQKIDTAIEQFGNQLVQLDLEQQAYLKRQKIAKIGMIAIALIYVGIIFSLKFSGFSTTVAAAISTVTLAIMLKLAQNWYLSQADIFSDFYKKHFIKEIITLFYPHYSFQYLPDSFPSHPELSTNSDKKQQIVQQDFIKGVSGNLAFNINHVVDEISNFKGILYTIPLHKELPLTISFTPKVLPSEMVRMHLAVPDETLSPMDCPIIKGHFIRLLTNNPELLPQLITPDFVLQLRYIQQVFNRQSLPDFSLIDNTFYILIPNYKQYLEISPMTPIEHHSVITRLIKQVDNIMAPIEKLLPILDRNLHQIED